MIKKFIAIILMALFILPGIAYADFEDIISMVAKIYGVNLDIKNLGDGQLEQLSSLVKGTTGTHSYGSMYQDNKKFDWGNGADNWQSMLSLYKNGSTGELAGVAHTLSKEYPISNLGSTNDTENKYYLLQSQTTLASRSSSQLAFNQIAKDEKALAKLQKEIDKSKDIKSSADLNNRLVSEQNNLSIQQAKMLAILVQQSAVDSQAKANRAKEDAEFFDYK